MIVKPPPCQDNVEYTCVCITCPVDLCQYPNDALTKAFLDPVTGVFIFSSTDKIGVPPGDYVIQILGTISDTTGDHTAFNNFSFTIADPCVYNSLVIPTPPEIPVLTI
jgi:hypothetical protein